MKRSIKHIYVGIISLLCIGGMSACGESRTPDFKKETLSSPEGLYLSIRYSEEQTDYVLTWETVANSAGYEISIDGAAVATLEGFYVDEYDVTEHVQTGKSYEFGIKALGDEQEYNSSETATTQATAEEVTEKLLYTPLEDEDGACEVKADGNLNGKVVIPDEYNGWIVTKIANEAFYEITLAESNGITAVRVPETVQRIGTRAFIDSAFKSIEIPDGVWEIGDSAFSACDFLECFTFPSGTRIVPANIFFSCGNLKEVCNLEHVTEIEYGAFYACRSLEKVSLGESLEKIGDTAFRACESLTKIDIPQSVTSIGNMVFSRSGIASINVAEGNAIYCSIDGNLYLKNGKTFVCYAPGKTEETFCLPENVSGIGEYAFYFDLSYWEETSLKKVLLPNGLTDIGTHAFVGSSITEMDLPTGIKTIENNVFFQCRNLKRISVPSGLKSIGVQAFYGCSSLEEFLIPSGVESIGRMAFAGCSSLKSMILPESVTELGSAVFSGCKEIENVVLPSGITRIENSFFDSCESLQTIDIPENVVAIGKNAFKGCLALENIDLPEGVTSIGEWAFASCVLLKSIDIPRGVVSIEESLFYSCEALNEIVIHNGITTIEWGAFTDCVSLEKVTFEKESRLKSLGGSSFYGCTSLTEVEIPSSVESVGAWTFFESGITEINVAEGSVAYQSVDGNLYSKDGKTLVCYAAGKRTEEFVLPNGVTHLAECAFSGCDYLKSIELNEGFLSIGEYAFAYCDGLTVLELPSTIEFVGFSAFGYALNLKTVILPNTVEKIWQGSFSDSFIQYIDLPNGVTEIGASAFTFCEFLQYIIIPKTVKIIADSPFSIAGMRVFYMGSSKEWDKITGRGKLMLDYTATRYYYSESEPPLSEDGTAYDGNYWHYDENGVPMVWTKEETEE